MLVDGIMHAYASHLEVNQRLRTNDTQTYAAVRECDEQRRLTIIFRTVITEMLYVYLT